MSNATTLQNRISEAKNSRISRRVFISTFFVNRPDVLWGIGLLFGVALLLNEKESTILIVMMIDKIGMYFFLKKKLLPASTRMETKLFFGLSVPGDGVVSDEDWKAFANKFIIPVFASGLTILNAEGFWWEMATGKPIREGAKIMLIAHEDDEAISESIDRIRALYKECFHQEAVLRITSHAGFLSF